VYLDGTVLLQENTDWEEGKKKRGLAAVDVWDIKHYGKNVQYILLTTK